MEITANIPGKGLAKIQIRGDRIGAVEVQSLKDAEVPYASPGFIDIQLNGFAGIDFCDENLDAKRAVRILPELWKTGTGSFCPTLITNTRERLLHNFRVLEEARKMDSRFARTVPCYHLEGPYISPGPSRGAHDSRFMRPPDWEEFTEFQRAAGGRIGIVTLAPEWPGALDFIRRAREAGVVVSIGHTDGTPEQIHHAVEAGANLCTHLGNGCPQTIDRHRNTFWSQMVSDQLSASIISDGFHLPRDLVCVILRVKGLDRCILITDAVHVAGMLPGRYSIVGLEIELLPTGQVVMADRGCMAGSALSMDRAVSIFMQFTGVSLQDAVRVAATNPARLLHRYENCAEIAEGQLANLTLFRLNGNALKIEALILGGEVVYSSGGNHARP